ncbi:MAG: tRNA 4-thiouridine(8) synthase ThiI [Parasporobacterium sp.]|nr:tRNA 4-thiouridine(8) synthase ThiI [Parasporobacterium sp.]
MIYLIKYSEIGIKGNNRHIFEDMLVKNIRAALRLALNEEYKVWKAQGRIYARSADSEQDETIEALLKVFGIAGIAPVTQFDRCTFEEIQAHVIDYMGEKYGLKNADADKTLTFKVHTRRADKAFPVNSTEVNEKLGEVLLDAYPALKVDVHEPDVLLHVEIRPEGVNVYSEIIPGLSGMPVGSSGKAMLLLSGGIDSPVAGYMVAKRGVSIDAIYFHAPPYTSERAKQKVVDLAKIVAAYSGPMNLYVVNFTDIQMAIYETCPHDELTIIMRRYMMRLAEHFALENGALGLVTGESIGQVASQTMQSMLVTNEPCTIPVYRPLCAFDKLDIVAISEKINAYETSILPYEDCCTIFVAKHPVTKPRLDRIVKSEKLLDGKIEPLFAQAVDSVEVIKIG